MKTSVKLERVSYHAFLHNAREEIKIAKTIYPQYSNQNYCNRSAKRSRELFEKLYLLATKKAKNLSKLDGKKGNIRRADKKNCLIEFVVVVRPDTTKKQLILLEKEYERITGFKCLQIANHKDEGHIDKNNNFIINNHAHFTFITLSMANGQQMFRRIHLTKAKLTKLQDVTANILNMERGTPKQESKQVSLNHVEYKRMVTELNKQIKNLKLEFEKKYRDQIYKEIKIKGVPTTVTFEDLYLNYKELYLKAKDNQNYKILYESELQKNKDLQTDFNEEVLKVLDLENKLETETKAKETYHVEAKANEFIIDNLFHEKFLSYEVFKSKMTTPKTDEEHKRNYLNYIATLPIAETKNNQNKNLEKEISNPVFRFPN